MYIAKVLKRPDTRIDLFINIYPPIIAISFTIYILEDNDHAMYPSKDDEVLSDI